MDSAKQAAGRILTALNRAQWQRLGRELDLARRLEQMSDHTDSCEKERCELLASLAGLMRESLLAGGPAGADQVGTGLHLRLLSHLADRPYRVPCRPRHRTVCRIV